MSASGRKTGYSPAPPRRPGDAAFTLIELMVVVFIIGILTTLVVGISRHVYEEAGRRETQSVQNVVMAAVEAYYEIMKVYPSDNYGDELKPTYPTELTETQVLVCRLKGQPLTHPLVLQVRKACAEKLLELPRDRFDGSNACTIYDGFGQPMQYDQDGGLGGRPVLVSAGPDKKPGTNDDIRSDEH